MADPVAAFGQEAFTTRDKLARTPPDIQASASMYTHVCVCNMQFYQLILCTYIRIYSETSLIRHSMGPENNFGLGGCWIMECLLPYLCMVTVPHIMVGLERMLDYRGVGLERFHCIIQYDILTYIIYIRTVAYLDTPLLQISVLSAHLCICLLRIACSTMYYPGYSLRNLHCNGMYFAIRTSHMLAAGESPLQLKPPAQDSLLVLSGTPREVAQGNEDLMKLALLTSRTSRSPAKSLTQTPSRHDGSIHLEFQSGQLARSCSRSQPRNMSIDEKHLLSFGGSQPQSDRTVPSSSDIDGRDTVHISTDQILRGQLLYTAGETPPCIRADTDFNSLVSSSHRLSPEVRDEKDNSTPSHYSRSLPESSVDSLLSNHSTLILTPSLRVAQNPPLPLAADQSHGSEGSTSTPQNLPDEFLPSEPPTPFKDASMVDDRDVDQLSPAEDRQSVLSNASIISSLHGQQELSGTDSASSSPSLALTSISIPDNPSEVLFTTFSNTHHSILSSPVVSSEPLIHFTPAPPQRRGSGKRYSKLSNTNLFGGDVSIVDNTVEDLLTGTPRVGLQRHQPIITATPSDVGGLSTGVFLTGTPRPTQHRPLAISTTAGLATNETLSTVDLLTGTPRPTQSRLPPVSTAPSLSPEGGLLYPHGASVRNPQI